MKELKNRLAAFSNTTLGSELAIAFFFVMFILLQIPSTFALGGAINSVTPEGIKKFVIAYALCSVLTIYLFARFRWAPVSRDYIRTKPWAVMVWSVFLGIGSIVPSMVLQEMFEFERRATDLQGLCMPDGHRAAGRDFTEPLVII